MGTLTSVLGALGPTLVGYGGIPGFLVNTAAYVAGKGEEAGRVRTQQKLALDQLQARQQQDEALLVEKNELERQRLLAEAEANDARRRNALRRAVARQKTLFSAQGISPLDGGSNEAVLLGLYDESLAKQNEDDRLNTLRRNALDQNLSAVKQKNLLETTQLGQQQHLYRVLNGY